MIRPAHWAKKQRLEVEDVQLTARSERVTVSGLWLLVNLPNSEVTLRSGPKWVTQKVSSVTTGTRPVESCEKGKVL